MFLFTLLAIYLNFGFNAASELQSCSMNVSSKQLCFTSDEYGKSFPNGKWPLIVYNSVTVHDIVEFSPDENTMTIFVQLMVWWKDTALSLKSTDPLEYT